MTTRNIVPRATGEGSIGTPQKKWNSVNIKNINAESIDTDNIDVDNLNVYSERTAPVNTLQRETAYAADDIVYTSKLNAKYYLLCITAGTTASVEPSFVGAESNTQITDGTVVWRVQTVTSQEKAAGVPVGFEYFQMNPNVPAGSLPMLGGVYSRETYADLWAWVQTQSGYLKTEAEWQTLSTANNGNVPYYSSGDGSTTFRVPSLKCWVKGANGTVSEVGSYLAAGLPNITGAQTSGFGGYLANASSGYAGFGGAFSGTDPTIAHGTFGFSGSNANRLWLDFDASKSNAIYGNSTTVQPESIVGMWLVKAYGTIVDTGTIDEQAYIDDRMNAMTQYVNSSVGAINTRLGNVLETTGSSTAVNSNATLCSISTHPAGVWLIVSFVTLDYTSANTYNNVIVTTSHGSTLTRNTSGNGGGSTAVMITELDENELVSAQGYKVDAGKIGAKLTMVQLA